MMRQRLSTSRLSQTSLASLSLRTPSGDSLLPSVSPVAHSTAAFSDNSATTVGPLRWRRDAKVSPSASLLFTTTSATATSSHLSTSGQTRSVKTTQKQTGKTAQDELKYLKIDMTQMRAKGALKVNRQYLAVNDHNATDTALETAKAALRLDPKVPAEDKFPEHMSWLFDWENGDLNNVLGSLIAENQAEPAPALFRSREIREKLRALTNTLLVHIPAIKRTIKVEDVNVDLHLENAVLYPLPDSLAQPLGLDEISLPMPSPNPTLWHPFMQQFVYTLDALLPAIWEFEGTTAAAEGKKKTSSSSSKKKDGAAGSPAKKSDAIVSTEGGSAEEAVDMMLPVKILDFKNLAKQFQQNMEDDAPRKLQDLAKAEEIKFWINKVMPTLDRMLEAHKVEAKGLEPIRMPDPAEFDDSKKMYVPKTLIPLVQYLYQRKGVTGPQTTAAAISGIPVFSHAITDFKAAQRDHHGDALDFVPRHQLADFLGHIGSAALWLDLGYCLHPNPSSNSNAMLRMVEPQHTILLEAADHYDYVTDGTNSGFLLYYNLDRVNQLAASFAAVAANAASAPTIAGTGSDEQEQAKLKAAAVGANLAFPQAAALRRLMANLPLLLGAAAETHVLGSKVATSKNVFLAKKNIPEPQKSVLFVIMEREAEKVHKLLAKVSNNIRYYSFEYQTIVHMYVPASFDIEQAVTEIIGEERIKVGGLHVGDPEHFNKMGSNCFTVSARTTNPGVLMSIIHKHGGADAIFPGKYGITRLRPYITMTVVTKKPVTPELHRELQGELPTPNRETDLQIQGSRSIFLEVPLQKVAHEKNLVVYREKKAERESRLAEWHSVSVVQQIKQVVGQAENLELEAAKIFDEATCAFVGARTDAALQDLKKQHAEAGKPSYDLPLLFHRDCKHWSVVQLKKDAYNSVVEDGVRGHFVARDAQSTVWMEALTMTSLEEPEGGFAAEEQDESQLGGDDASPADEDLD